MDGGPVVVCDNGSGFLKCGLAGDAYPRAVVPNLVGRPLEGAFGTQPQPSTSGTQGVFVGAAAAAHPHNLQLSYPVSNGIVQSWEDMQLVWDQAFKQELQVDPHDCRILLTDPPLNPTANRERMLQTMFETYGFQGAFVQVQAVLTLYSQGLLSGLVLDSGDGVTHAVPVVEGYSMPHLTKRLNVAGRHISAYLLDLLARRGYSLSRSADLESVRHVKEKVCYVALDYKREVQLARETTCTTEQYTLPDGRTIRVAAERFTAPEAMFNPSLLGVEAPGIAEMVHSCIQDNEIDNRRQLQQHILLSGGSTLYPGIASRLERELRQLYLDRVLKGERQGLKKLKLKVEDPPRRRHLVFLGGAVLADIMRGQPEFWITKQEWAEDPHRALKKCGSV